MSIADDFHGLIDELVEELGMDPDTVHYYDTGPRIVLLLGFCKPPLELDFSELDYDIWRERWAETVRMLTEEESE